MTRFSKQHLQEKIQSSEAIQLIVPSFRQAIVDLAESKQLALQRTIFKILDLENTNDLQTVYFTEQMLEHFVETNCAPTNKNQITQEFQAKAERLIRTCMLIDLDKKAQYLKILPTLSYQQIRDLIEVLLQGHRKQNQFLQDFVEKDPHQSTKFQALVTSLTK